MYNGIAASDGIGIGRICIITEHELTWDHSKKDDIQTEQKRLKEAIEALKLKTSSMADDVRKRIGPKEAQILEGHLVMISDPEMHNEMSKMVEGGQCAESAVEAVCDMFIDMFSKMDDELMKQRASDISDVKKGLLKLLLGIEDIDIGSVPPGTILVSKDLTPSMTSQIVKENVSGIITEFGGSTSHSAILARALEIPAVLSVPDITALVENNVTAIVDGSEGIIYINPSEDTLSKYTLKRKEFIKKKSDLSAFVLKETKTYDGIRLNLLCNLETHKDAQKVIEYGGEGIGLFRSEFLFMNRNHMPTEDEQFDAYREVAKAMGDKPVVIRTLDIGGDKGITYLNLKKEDNPFLGYRAIRYCLGNKDLFSSQLRAIIRASSFGQVRIMLPLISCVDEIRAVKELASMIKDDFDKAGIPYDKNIKIGCMIETPSASLIADLLAKEADFFSIGTNDLTQYTMSADRTNADVSKLCSPFQPAVLRSIKHIIECGKKAGIPVGMCGEAAADPLMIPLLISFGLSAYSVNPSLVPATRCIISKWSKKEADELAGKVMELDTEEEIIKLLKENAKE